MHEANRTMMRWYVYLENIHIHFQQIISPLDWPDKKLGRVAQRWKSLKSAEWKERREWVSDAMEPPIIIWPCVRPPVYIQTHHLRAAWSISQADTSDVIFDINCVCASTSTPRALSSVSIARTHCGVWADTESKTLLAFATDKFSHSGSFYSRTLSRAAPMTRAIRCETVSVLFISAGKDTAFWNVRPTTTLCSVRWSAATVRTQRRLINIARTSVTVEVFLQKRSLFTFNKIKFLPNVFICIFIF